MKIGYDLMKIGYEYDLIKVHKSDANHVPLLVNNWHY